jgi:hypothetical protein
MKMSTLIKGIAVACCCSSLLGCGGSSDDDDAPASQSVVSVGTISGFGSVIVNGVRFDDSNAVVTINDLGSTSGQLKVGMVVAVEGSVDACPNADAGMCSGIASRIRFRNNLEGPITTINRLNNSLQVMGRDIVVDDSTMFDGTTVADLGGLAVGDVVMVSGLTEQARIRARLLQRTGTFVNGTTAIMLHGTVANVNAALGTCTVDGVPVLYQGLASANLPAGGPANGQYVSVQGKGYGNGSGLMTADRIQLRDRISYPDASLVELEGFVSGFVSVADFLVDGQQVDASNAIFRNGVAADLEDGVKVEVEGTVAGAVLVATKVIFRSEANAQIVAPIQSKDAATASVVLLGQKVVTTPLTQFVDQSGATGQMLRTIGYPDLTVADRIDVRAYKDAAGKLVATRIVRTEPDPLLIVKAAADAKFPVTRMTVLGITATTSPSTRYRDVWGNLIAAVDFYNLVQVPPALPTIVRVQGVASPTSESTLDATRATSTRGEVEIAQ